MLPSNVSYQQIKRDKEVLGRCPRPTGPLEGCWEVGLSFYTQSSTLELSSRLYNKHSCSMEPSGPGPKEDH